MPLHHRALQQLIDSLTVDTISEAIKSIPATEDASRALYILQENHFDVLGVRNLDGKVIGYVAKNDLKGGKVEDYIKNFHIDEIISFSAHLESALLNLCKKNRLFVLGNNGIESIVTVADLQKVPVRMMLFGVISLLEMDLLQWIRVEYQNEEWKEILTEGRLKKAMDLYEERRRRNQEIDLAECLQLCDKTDVLINNDRVRSVLNFKSPNEAEEFFKELQELRNYLAHSQDPAREMEWPKIAELIARTKDVSKNLLILIENSPH